MTIAANVWLPSTVCLAQKVTDVSVSYFPTRSYGNLDRGFYWDANGDGKKERLATDYRLYAFPEGALPIARNGSYSTYYMPFEPTSTLFQKDGKWYVRVPSSDGATDHEVNDSKTLFTLMGKQKCISDGKESTYNYERELSVVKEGELSRVTSSSKKYVYLYKSAGILYVGLRGQSSSDLYTVPDYEMARDTIDGYYKVSLFRVQSQDDLYYLLYHPNWNFFWQEGNIYSSTLQSTSSYEYRWAWIDSEGKPVKVTNISDYSSNTNSISNGHVYDFNGDGQPDFMKAANSNIIYMSDGNDEYVTVDVSFTKQQLKDYVVADINHDGRLDFFGYEEAGSSYESGIGWNGTQTTTYVPVVYVQTAEGQFVREYPTLVTNADELRDAMYSTGGNGSFNSTSSVPNGWMVQAPALELGTTKTAEVTDINNDGYPDILYPDGRAFLSLSDGRYYAAEMKGKFSICDLNGDGIKDIVTYDTNGQKVLVDVSQQDGTFKQTKLIDNGNITGIYCMDLDGDGLVDIQLQAVTSTYSFLVFFKNKGDGTFKKTERALSGKYDFTRPVFLKNNGRPTILIHAERAGYIGSWTPSYRLKRIDWDANFALSESYVTCDKDTLCIHEDFASVRSAEYEKSIADYTIDYDGDGLIDIPGYLNTGTDSLRYVLYTDNATNTAPQRMARPSVIYDKQTGRVRVGWKDGNDRETAAGDLTYTVRMGTAEGADDLLYYEAGRSNYCVVNAGSWPQGTVRVAVSATDTQGRQGQWSESASFGNVVVVPDVLLSAPVLSTADTLVATPLACVAGLTITASPDGKMLQSTDGATRFVFHTAGVKTITANVAGGVSMQKTVKVTPFNINTEKPMSYNGYFDLNGNGINERFCYSTNTANDGIYTFENGAFSKLATLFNSDLSFEGSHNSNSSYNYSFTDAYVTDKNMDGLPDIFGIIKKNNTLYNWLINTGDLDFEASSDNCPPKPGASYNSEYRYRYADINNDGYIDYYLKKYDSKLYINKGDFTFEEIPVEGLVMDHGDVDGDGLLDLLTYYDDNSGHRDYNIWRNKGNAQFEKVFSVSRRSFCNHSLADVNDDGVLDILRLPEYNVSEKPDAVILDSKFQDKGERAVPGAPLYADTGDGTLSFYYRERPTFDSLYWQKDGMQAAYPVFRHNNGNYDSSNPRLLLTDLDNDSRPEAFAVGNSALSLGCSYTNTPPTAPSQVFVNQTDDAVVVAWSGASDAETPAHRLRYNLSVKKKGAEGEGSYVISPLNMTSDVAKTTDLGTMQYRYATRFPIPFSRFEAGATYEIRVQTIDGWTEHSPFSAPIEFTPSATMLFSMPEKAAVGQAVAFTCKDNIGGELTIDANEGKLDGNTITWQTSGVKTVSVTAGGEKSVHSILILPRPDLTFDLPQVVLTGTTLKVPVAEGVTVTANDGVTVKQHATTASITIPERAGTYELTVSHEDSIFGQLSTTFSVKAIAYQPEISIVASGNDGNTLTWTANVADDVASLLTGRMNIYRETSLKDQYELIGETDISSGRYTDTSARPDVKSYRYRIAAPTTYGSESLPSTVHGTVLLLVNKGMGTDINLHWNAYTGAEVEQYTILAGSHPDNLQTIETLPGYTQSYVHKRGSDATTYYAINYTLSGSAAARSYGRAAAQDADGMSNVISSEEAYDVTMAESISINTQEEEAILNAEQPMLHLQATVAPVLATLKRVEWSIAEGSHLATVNQDGELSIRANRAGGSVVVQARAIDGSDVVGTINIMVAAYSAGPISGDANGDGKVNTADIMEMVNSMLGKPSDKFNMTAADANGDGQVNVADIVKVRGIILNGEQ